MQGRDGCLGRERPGFGAERFRDERQRFGDLRLIPQPAVLLFESDEIAGLIDTGSAP